MPLCAFTYLLASRRNGALFVGVTSDLENCVLAHKIRRTPGHTTKYLINNLVWYRSHVQLPDALRQEMRIKKYPRRWKINLIESENPNWRDLFMEIAHRSPALD